MTRNEYRPLAISDVPVEDAATGPREASIAAFAKKVTPAFPYVVANEFVCAGLAQVLGLPVPPACLLRHPDGPWFASIDFEPPGGKLPPVDPAACFAELPDLSTGVLFFDILVANQDRHPKNLRLDMIAGVPRLNVFDHERCLLGFIPHPKHGVNRLRHLWNHLGITAEPQEQTNPHCLLPVVNTTAHFRKWAGRVRSIPDHRIEDLCQDAVGLGITPEEARVATEFLKHRRDSLTKIIDDDHAAFTAITNWSDVWTLPPTT